MTAEKRYRMCKRLMHLEKHKAFAQSIGVEIIYKKGIIDSRRDKNYGNGN